MVSYYMVQMWSDSWFLSPPPQQLQNMHVPSPEKKYMKVLEQVEIVNIKFSKLNKSRVIEEQNLGTLGNTL